MLRIPLEGLFIANMAQKMKEIAPYLWDLVYALLDANPLHRMNMEQDHRDPGNEAVDEQESKAKKCHICVASQKTALLVDVHADTLDFIFLLSMLYPESCCFHQYSFTEYQQVM
jgi:hypothetical protein